MMPDRNGGRSISADDGRPLRLAYFSPLPPARSGIADYSWDLLPHLGRLAEVTLFSDGPAIDGPLDKQPLAAYPAARRQFDLALYHMGNNELHESIYRIALRYPGVVTLHDHGLGHFIASTLGTAERYDEYVRELGYAQGGAGVDLAWQVRYGGRPYPLHELPLNDRLVDRSLALIVHSQAAAAMLAQRRPEKFTGVIAQQMPLMPARPDRRQLGLDDEDLVFASVGQVTAAKRLDLALSAFAQLRQEFPQAKFLIVGEALAEARVDEVIRKLDLADAVRLTGHAPDLQQFVDWTAAADVVLALRQPTIGETSAGALRAMATGRPLIVFDHGWYHELPDDVCQKVAPGDQAALLEAMLTLARQTDKRRKMGRRAQRCIGRDHDPATVAASYVDFLDNVLAGINRRYGGV